MSSQNLDPAAGGHLSFYRAHGISPVRYQMASYDEHFQRRDSLYRGLGLPAVAFKGARVLEVAPGSGQNSLYLATCEPASLDLVEPNPKGIADIKKAFDDCDAQLLDPRLHECTFQEFETDARFDIVVCENWLGCLPQELDLVRRLSSLVAEGGVLVVTAVPLTGFFPNVLRKVLAVRLMQPGDPFEQQTQHLLDAFSPHLSTIAGMTRSHRDWVHDCMINPHYLNVALPFETLVSAVDPEMEWLATSPRFSTDWRWFKRLVGDERNGNAVLVEAGLREAHNFMDHRAVSPSIESSTGARLAEICAQGYNQALRWETAYLAGNIEESNTLQAALGDSVKSLASALDPINKAASAGFDEVAELWARDTIMPSDVAAMEPFASLFGRETVYVSLTRPVWGGGERG